MLSRSAYNLVYKTGEASPQVFYPVRQPGTNIEHLSLFLLQNLIRMKSTLIIAAIAAVARAQEIDWEAYDSVDKPTPVSAPIGGGTETINYDENAAAASVVAEVKSTTDDAPQRRDVLDNHIRINAKRAPCEAQPLGAGPVSSPDTAAAFLSDDVYAAKALAAPVPSGYRQTFSNLAASSSAYGYMGFVTLQSYDTALCASKCNAINGCSAINIYFERDPTVVRTTHLQFQTNHCRG